MSSDDYDDAGQYDENADHIGDVLLNDIIAWLDCYVVTMSEDDTLILALWALHTYLAAETYTTPRLLIDSPMPGSGKTTCLEHLHRLSWWAVQMATVSSPAMIPRMLEAGPRTLLIDEADRALRPDKDGVEDLLAVLNSGYKKGGTRPVLVPAQGGRWEAQEMSTFAPVAMAGNNPNLPDDTRSRCIRVLLLPDMHGVAEDSDWELIEDDAKALAKRIAEWADSVRKQMPSYRGDLPQAVRGRFKEKWRPLRRVAQAAGGKRTSDVDRLAEADVEQLKADVEDGMARERPAVILLRDLRAVWPEGKDFVPTTIIIERLIRHNPNVWSAASSYGKDLTAQRFARMMSQAYRVSPQRPHTQRPRGYVFAALEPIWHRMRIPPPGEPDKSAEPDKPDNRHLVDVSDLSGSAGLSGPSERACANCGSPISEIRAIAGFDTCAECRQPEAVGA